MPDITHNTGPPAPPDDMTTSPLSLSALVQAAQGRIAQAAEAKQAKARVAKATNAAERTQATEAAAAILQAMAWHDAALILHIRRYQCACGRAFSDHGQIMLLQEHARLANAIRMIPSALDGHPELPRRRYLEPVENIPHCSECLRDFQTLYAPPVPFQVQWALAHPGPYVKDWIAKRNGPEAVDPTPEEDDDVED